VHEHDETLPTTDARTWWETRYAERDGIWSGRVNAVLESVASTLPAGRALDLGCGEGGDVVWLAEHGWTVTGVDLSATAVARAEAAASRAGVGERAHFVAADLATWTDGGGYDLVTASFLQSWPVEIPRAEILRRAATLVGTGGRLLVTAHAAPPHGDLPEEMQAYRFPSSGEDLRALQLDDGWEVLEADERPRTATTPDGHEHRTVDSVVLVRRR
jgi:SAM-dependent methyltransferase